MRFSTAIDGATAEKVFGTFRNSITKTTTATAATIARGAPVILATATASCNGYDIQRAITTTAAVYGNNLFVGVAANYPDTSTGQTGVWNAEDVGQVQIYGYHSAGVVRGFESAIAIGTILVPNSGFSGVFETVEPLYAAAASSNQAHAGINAVAGLCYVAEQLASYSTSTDSKTSAIFIRAM